MDSKQDEFLRFHRFLRSFQCERVPSVLLVRSCEPKVTWSPRGEVIEKLPLEAGVPEWLVNFYNTHKPLFHDPDLGKHIEGINLCIENGIHYFQVAKAMQREFELDQQTLITEELTMAQERLSVVLQAFPSINIEIIGEEIVDRLMDITKSSVLPLLSCVTDEDIEDWLLPKNLEKLDLFMFSLFEFFYQVIIVLGIDHPLLPLSLLGRILSIIPSGVLNNPLTSSQAIAHILNGLTTSGQNALQYSFLSPETKTDERSNASVGFLLSMLLSGITIDSSGGPDERLAEALSIWKPLSPNSPSTLEYLAAISFCSRPQLNLIRRPPLSTLDTCVLEGLLLSRRKQHDEAIQRLEGTKMDIVSQYGLCSMQVGIAMSERANCYNILRREQTAELLTKGMLDLPIEPGLRNRRDRIYLKIVLADSFIGRGRYNEALPMLQSIVDDPDIPATLRMMSALRLAKSRRRMREDPHEAFEQNSPLWAGSTLLTSVPGVLAAEYAEELACSISEMPRVQSGYSKKLLDLMRAVDSVLGKSRSVTDSPSWGWFTQLQQEYLSHVANATRLNKGKYKDESIQSEDTSENATPVSSQAPRLPLRANVDISDDEGPWSERLVLSFDGGGVRALSSLLILKRIMQRIRELEIDHPNGPAYSSSSYPWMGMRRDASEKTVEPDRLDEFLPCHYFDYMIGSSTGGLCSIMLGRLRLSVDNAIFNLIDFSNSVFRDPRSLHQQSTLFLLRAKYSSVKAREALERIATRNQLTINLNKLSFKSPAIGDRFTNQGYRTRTMAVSSCVKDDVEFEHIWRSYEVPARVSLNSNEAHTSKTTSIWQVALATFAHPLYFDPIEISGYKFLDGGLAASNPSYIALREILGLHSKAPAAFINLGTGLNRPVSSDYISIGTIINHGASRASLLRSSPHFPRMLTEWHFTNTEWETQQWLEQAARIGLEQAYRLDAEGDLHKIPFDDWRPTGTGQETIQKITEITNHYLDTDPARDTIDRIANKAVRIRRSRTYTERWEAFAIDLDYTCVLCLRPTLKPHCKYRADLRAHLEKRHADWHMTEEEVEEYLDAGRRYSGEDPLATE